MGTVASADTYRCAACHGGAFESFGERLGYTYVKCAVCASLQLEPMPTQEFLIKKYEEDYAESEHIEDVTLRDRAALPYYMAIIDAIAARVPAGGRVMDYGAGWGGLSACLKEQGYEVVSVEPSDSMSQHCQARGLNVVQGDLFHPSLQGPFDAILLSFVFEHLVDHDGWLDRASSLLANGGVFLSSQPTAPFPLFFGNLLRLGDKKRPLPQLHQVICPPWHTVLFSLDGMDRLLRRHHLDMLEIRRTPQGRSGGLTGLLQLVLDKINILGWALMGARWPGIIGHIFVAVKQ